MTKEIKKYLPLYLGCEYWTNNSQGELNHVTLPHVMDMCDRDCGVQLHLRPISDISDSEWMEIETEIDLFFDARGIGGLKDAFLIDTSEHRLGWSLTNSAITSLRRRLVDMDGLIVQGMAVNLKEIR